MVPSTWRLVAAFAAIYIIWGSTYLAIRFAIETLPGFLMAGARFLIAGAVLFVWARLRGADRPTAGHWLAAAVLGLLFLCFGNGGVVWAEHRVPSGLAALLVALVPVWTVVIEWLWPGGRRPAAGVVAGLLVGLGGVALLVVGNNGGAGQVDPVGAAALLAASISWSFAGVLSPKLRLPGSASLSSGMQMLTGGASLLLVGVLTGETAAVAPEAVSGRSLLAVGYLIVFGSLVGFSAFAWLLRVSTPSRVATYAYVNPAVAVFLGWAFAGEQLTARSMAAAAVIIAAVVLITRAKAVGAVDRQAGGRPDGAGDERAAA